MVAEAFSTTGSGPLAGHFTERVEQVLTHYLEHLIFTFHSAIIQAYSNEGSRLEKSFVENHKSSRQTCTTRRCPSGKSETLSTWPISRDPLPDLPNQCPHLELPLVGNPCNPSHQARNTLTRSRCEKVKRLRTLGTLSRAGFRRQDSVPEVGVHCRGFSHGISTRIT